MRVSLVYVALLLIFIIVLLAADIGMPMTVSLIAIIVGVLSILDGTEYMEVGTAQKDSTPIAPKTEQPPMPEVMPWKRQDAIGYSRDSMINQNQTDSYSICYEPVRPIVAFGADLDSSADSALALIGLQRARDKKTLDGVALKDASFYKYYYDDDLSLEENRPWWGRAEY